MLFPLNTFHEKLKALKLKQQFMTYNDKGFPLSSLITILEKQLVSRKRNVNKIQSTKMGNKLTMRKG